MATAITAPDTACALFPTVASTESPGIMPSVPMIVPIRSDAKRPSAMALIASIKYLFAYFFKASFMKDIPPRVN